MPTLSFPTWRDVPEQAWRWPSFSPAEIACRGTGAIRINTEAMDKLQALRDRLGKPLIVRSAYRSPEHNRAVGGAPASKHIFGRFSSAASAEFRLAALRRKDQGPSASSVLLRGLLKGQGLSGCLTKPMPYR